MPTAQYIETPYGMVTIREFEESDASSIPELYRDAYGDTFPFRPVYDSQFHKQSLQNDNVYRVVAVDPQGSIIGTSAIFRSERNNANLFEGGGLIVKKGMARYGSSSHLCYMLDEICKEHGVKISWCENVTTHAASQVLSGKCGYISSALEVNAMRIDESGQSMYESLLACFKFYTPPTWSMRNIPEIYREELEYIYQAIGAVVDNSVESFQSETENSMIHSETSLNHSVSKIHFESIGKNYKEEIALWEKEADTQAIELRQIFFPMEAPCNNEIISYLRSCGYFFGGLFPSWIAGKDALLMQKTTASVDFEKIKVLGQYRKKIVAMVKADFDRVR